MTEREKVLLQRVAVREYFFRAAADFPSGLEERLRRLFPLPPEKVPNVVRTKYDVEFRQNPETGRIEYRHINKNWLTWFESENEAAIRAVIAEPYRLVSGEDGET